MLYADGTCRKETRRDARIAWLHHLATDPMLHADGTCRKETRQDARIAWLHHLATAPVARLMGLVHPSLYDLNAIVEASPGEPARLPLPIGAISAAKVLADGVYLLENGAFVYIYIGPDVPAELQRQLLGEPLPTLQAGCPAVKLALGCSPWLRRAYEAAV